MYKHVKRLSRALFYTGVAKKKESRPAHLTAKNRTLMNEVNPNFQFCIVTVEHNRKEIFIQTPRLERIDLEETRKATRKKIISDVVSTADAGKTVSISSYYVN